MQCRACGRDSLYIEPGHFQCKPLQSGNALPRAVLHSASRQALSGPSACGRCYEGMLRFQAFFLSFAHELHTPIVVVAHPHEHAREGLSKGTTSYGVSCSKRSSHRSFFASFLFDKREAFPMVLRYGAIAEL